MEKTRVEMHLEEETKLLKEIGKKLCHAAQHELNNGTDSVDSKEMGEVIDMIKDITEAVEKVTKACYYKEILIAMEEAEGEDEEHRRYYRHGNSGRGRGRMRDARGRYMYTEPYMHMPEYMDDEMSDSYNNMLFMRDMDYPSGRMYYTERPMSHSGTFHSDSNMAAMPGRGSSRYGYSYDKLMDAHKTMNTSDPVQKKEHEKKHKEWQDDLMQSVEDVIMGATMEEKAQLKQALMKAAGKIQ